MCSESSLRAPIGSEIGNENGWRGVVGVGTAFELVSRCHRDRVYIQSYRNPNPSVEREERRPRASNKCFFFFRTLLRLTMLLGSTVGGGFPLLQQRVWCVVSLSLIVYLLEIHLPRRPRRGFSMMSTVHISSSTV
jgi:hypothetical protein